MKIRSIRKKYYKLVVFSNVTVPFISATQNIPIGNTARCATTKLKFTLTLEWKMYNTDIIVYSKCEKFSSFRGLSEKTAISLRFAYLFQCVIISSELFTAFRHL